MNLRHVEGREFKPGHDHEEVEGEAEESISNGCIDEVVLFVGVVDVPLAFKKRHEQEICNCTADY